MSGVGSFLKPCRTLFIGGVQKHKYESIQLIEAAAWKHFGEWGEIENVNLVQRLSVIFVRYRVRTSAGILFIFNIFFYYDLFYINFIKNIFD